MIHVTTYTEPGGHANNEDAFAIRTHGDDVESHLIVIADGQGGQPGGGAAARLACETSMSSALRGSLPPLLIAGTWAKILKAADRAVCDDSRAGLTTLVALCIANGFVCGASCGDSAAVLLKGDQPGFVLTAHQFKNPSVGSGMATFVPFAASLVAPWSILAFSDGVWKYVGMDSIQKISPVSSGEEIVKQLLNRARLPGGGLQDDFTIVVLHEDGI